MSKSKKTAKETNEAVAESPMHREILGLLWLALGLFLLLCLGSYSNADPSFNNNLNPQKIHNLIGIFGSHLADLLYQIFGLTAWLWPLGCLALAWRWLKLREVHLRIVRLIAFLLLQISLGGLLSLRLAEIQLFGSTIREAGGASGRVLVNLLSSYLNLGGAAIILILFFLVSLILSTRFSLVLFIDGFLERFGRKMEQGREARKAKQELRKKEKKNKQEPEIKAPLILPKDANKAVKAKETKKKKTKSEVESQEAFAFLEPSGSYHMPGLSLLDHDGGDPKPIDKESLTKAAQMLENKLLDFGVEGDVVEVKPGPVVTMYEFAPAPGVKVNKISNLQDDLAMALQAVSIRIVAPIPGRGVVGIEIPNKDRETVYLKEIIEDQAFQKTGGKLPMALGKDIFGNVVVSDLAKMPHLLVAGSTGSGKSVSINTMILSLLYRATPDDVRLIMIDPKMLELSIYEGIPHLLLPVVTNPKKASLALAWAVREMERRYQLMADKGVRNIDGYNRKLAKEEREAENLPPEPDVVEEVIEELEPPSFIEPEEELEHGHLPYIVVIVDELADLMMVAGREIEESIARLAQMARAAGIHLILATQRPSVDVITGLIKANFPTRISFKVFSRTDSRTVLDSMGAETLLGMGDMLFLPPGVGYLQRVHGAFVSELEVQRVVDFLSKQGDAEYDKSILQTPTNSDGSSGEEEDYDDRWDEALKIVSDTRQASISMLQRRLRVGYNRAARMIERMEQEGIVGPSDGSGKPREVLISKIE